MNGMVRYSNYREYKQELDSELQKSAEGFVKIGYLLKQARDTDILTESGYKNYIEFAQAEYSIDKTTVSRFIRINDKFAEGGNSEILMEQYRGFGYAKLAIMLQLPEEVNNIVTPDFSKAEITVLKEEVDEEKKTSDIEIILEGTETPQYIANNLEKAIWKLGKDEPQLYLQWNEAARIQEREEGIRKLIEILAPTESKIYMVRLQGMGRMALSIRAETKEITLINVRSEEKEIYDWEDVYAAVMLLMRPGEEKEAWQQVYEEPFPEEKAEVAPVQLSEREIPKETKKAETKTQSKVVKAKVESPKKKTEEIEHQQEEQIAGQKNIMEYPEYLPDQLKGQTGEVKDAEEAGEKIEQETEAVKEYAETVGGGSKGEETQKKEQQLQKNDAQEHILEKIEALKEQVKAEQWQQALSCVEGIVKSIQRQAEDAETEE